MTTEYFKCPHCSKLWSQSPLQIQNFAFESDCQPTDPILTCPQCFDYLNKQYIQLQIGKQQINIQVCGLFP